MIYTCTLNPSLDYSIKVENFEIGKTNRSSMENIYVGGKGINVSLMLKNLGHESIATGFISGFTGEEIKRQLKTLDIKHNFIELDNSFSRINIKFQNYESTEINGIGPNVNEKNIKNLLNIFNNCTNGDIIFLCGSAPDGVSDDIYKNILGILNKNNSLCVLDATKKLLTNALSEQPFLIKPNLQELSEIFSTEIQNPEDAFTYASKLQDKGAKNVIVSFGSKGAILLDENKKQHTAKALTGKVINAVGAGDSMLAGFIDAWLQTKDYEQSLQFSVKVACAKAFSKHFPSKTFINTLL